MERVALQFCILFSLLFLASTHAPGYDELTPLEKHAAFFDRNKDGVIYPSETYQGLRAIGCSVAIASAGSAAIHGLMSSKTMDSYNMTSPLLPIYVKNIHKCRHGSDSGAYDSEGRFVKEKFEAIFQNHAHTNPNALTEDELDEMLEGNKEPNDMAGSGAASQEWKLLYSLGKDKNGLLQKETIRGCFDGSLFYDLENADPQDVASS